jgi:hypothetical protein
MDLCRLFCCGSTNAGPNEETELVPGKGGNGERVQLVTQLVHPNKTGLPKIHVTNVNESFAIKLACCSSTPVPTLGSYHAPFPKMKFVHIIQDTSTSLKIVSLQYKSYLESEDVCLNLHHVFFPDYNNKNDPGENHFCFTDINDIKVNGETRLDICRQKVRVHDGRFSPELEPLAYILDDNPVVVSATIDMPNTKTAHLYHGFKQISMLNVIFPDGALDHIDDDLEINQLEDLIDPKINFQIQSFLDEAEHL